MAFRRLRRSDRRPPPFWVATSKLPELAKSAAAVQAPAVSRALENIARDNASRARYFDFTRDVDQPAVRARMLELAARLGWLSPAEKRAEIMQMINDQIAKGAVTPAEVDLVCSLN